MGAALLVGLACFLTGWLGLLLAIPPGFATAVWPPAGIALAGVLLFGPRAAGGVWAASFLLNLVIASRNAGSSPTLAMVLVSASIALGSTLQALAGAALIRRRIPPPLALDRGRDILAFLLLGGPLACLTASTWGVLTLRLAGVLPPSETFINWWTWWLGDALGVLAFTPLGLMTHGEPRDFWRRRRLLVGLPLMLAFGLMATFFVYIRRLEWTRFTGTYERGARALEERLRAGLASHLHPLRATAAFFHSSKDVDRGEFRTFSKSFLQELPSLHALEWVPRVPGAARASFEESVRSEGFPGFTIRERDGAGHLRPAGERPEYWPVQFVEPPEGNQEAFGLDLGSTVHRRATLERAWEVGNLRATAPLRLVQRGTLQTGVVVAQPVIRPGHAQQGWVLAVFRTQDLLSEALGSHGAESPGMLVRVTGRDEQGRPITVGFLRGTEKGFVPYDKFVRSLPDLAWTSSLPWAGQAWSMEVFPDPAALIGLRGWEAWAVLVAGSGFTGLLASILLLTSGRARLVEELVEARTAELHESQAHLLRKSRLLDQTQRTARVGGWEWDLIGTRLFWTPETFRIHGLPTSAPTPDLDQAIAFLGPAWAPAFRAALQAARHGEENLDVEAELQGADGLSRWVHITGRVEAGTGDAPRLYGAYQDVTQRRRAEQVKEQFVSIVSHELRTPLTALKGAMGLVVEGGERLGPQQRAELERVALVNAERLASLVNDLLDMEKLQSGKLDVRRAPFAPGPLAEEVARNCQALAEPTGCRIRLDLPENLPDLLADRFRTSQVLTNLLSNALKFSPPQGEVVIALEPLPDALRFSVTDQGPGVPAAFHDRIFQPFSQADASDTRARGGTGLGLNISKALVERMGGRIDFENRAEGGSRFWFELPVS